MTTVLVGFGILAISAGLGIAIGNLLWRMFDGE